MLRKIGVELQTFSETKSWISIGIPKNVDIYKAGGNFIGLSNGLCTAYNSKDKKIDMEHNIRRREEILDLLNIKEKE